MVTVQNYINHQAGTTKIGTRIILVQMCNIFRLLLGDPDYSCSESYREKQKPIGFIHRCLLRCGRECKGVGGVGPKFGTHVPDRDARGGYILLILDHLSRKLDANCTIVKNCSSFFRFAEAF